jgi:uridine kinase
MRYVVGVAGAAGAGKTSLVQALASAMPDASPIHIDNYQQITREPLHRLMEWMARGADVNEFAIPHLPEHLERLKRGVAVADPVSGLTLAPRKYVLLETHFGRAHRATGRYIDLLVWVDTPLDVALARNVVDFLQPVREADTLDAARERADWMHMYLRNYLAHTRLLVQAQKETVGADADLVVDGTAPIEEIAARVRRAILERLP